MSSIPLALRQALIQCLGSSLGTYSLSGQMTPAISVVPPPLSSERTVNGLEVIITRIPEFKAVGMLSSHTSVTRTWQIRLVDHNRHPVLPAAVEAVLGSFFQASVVILEGSDIAPPQAVITIPEPAQRLALSVQFD